MFLSRLAIVSLAATLLSACNDKDTDTQTALKQNPVSAAISQEPQHETAQESVVKEPQLAISKEPQPAADKEAQFSSNYRKPGAPIDFTHNYDGTTVAGELESFEITLSSRVKGGLKALVYSRDNILVGDNIEQSKPLEVGETLVIPVTVSSPTDGKFYLNVQASSQINEQKMGRAFSLAIYVGNWEKASKSTNGQVKTTGEGKEKVIIMPAQETIH